MRLGHHLGCWLDVASLELADVALELQPRQDRNRGGAAVVLERSGADEWRAVVGRLAVCAVCGVGVGPSAASGAGGRGVWLAMASWGGPTPEQRLACLHIRVAVKRDSAGDAKGQKT